MVRHVKGAKDEETARNRPDRVHVQTNEGDRGHGREGEIETTEVTNEVLVVGTSRGDPVQPARGKVDVERARRDFGPSSRDERTDDEDTE